MDAQAATARTFCALVGLVVEPAGVAAAFVLATAAAVLFSASAGAARGARAHRR